MYLLDLNKYFEEMQLCSKKRILTIEDVYTDNDSVRVRNS
jgi:hypothetical protein